MRRSTVVRRCQPTRRAPRGWRGGYRSRFPNSRHRMGWWALGQAFDAGALGESFVESDNAGHRQIKADAGGPIKASGALFGRVSSAVRDRDAQGKVNAR